ncbi:iron-containing alcohol dehydrogenase [Synechococcus sp. PCC 7336]|uniref:iron-containing alcohol dehydrogenase n=1 Tax=Synechococcus sp. PCC 7336 TaxID=195250 RepID=UPI00034D4D04|nr:iron-containing alcohol dehydrogenase [Synechococcus sp. PCC 7336]
MVAPSPSASVLVPAPAAVYRGWDITIDRAADIARLAVRRSGTEPTIARIFSIGGQHSLDLVCPSLERGFEQCNIAVEHCWSDRGSDCSESELARLRSQASDFGATAIVGIGGGKAIDTAKLVAHQLQLPIATIPTAAATCAAWTALSNVYSNSGAFQYDVPLDRAPDLLLLDYAWIQTAPPSTLKAGIGDALAKWYEASVSSSSSEDALTIAAVQQARVLRDLLLQKSVEAIACPGSTAWVQVVDACVCLAGVMGGLGGAKCRTVAAHAVHNGLTHLVGHKRQLHGAKVAFGILVQLRLEEILQGRALAATARQQLISFYKQIGLPATLEALQVEALQEGDDRSTHLASVAQIACAPSSDIHHLPFAVTPEALVVAMTTTHLAVSACERPMLSTP